LDAPAPASIYTLSLPDALPISAPLIQNEGPQMGRVVDSRAVSELPLATRNFTQILALSPGTSVALPDNSALGRNSQNVSVNGARDRKSTRLNSSHLGISYAVVR